MLLLGVRLALNAQPPNDQALIREALRQSVEASREGRPGGVLDVLSSQFEINNEAPGTRGQIAQFVRDSKPDVEVKNQEAVITGDLATIVSPVHLKVSFLGQTIDQEFPSVEITFRKEDSTRWLIVPTREWKLAEVRLREDVVGQFR